MEELRLEKEQKRQLRRFFEVQADEMLTRWLIQMKLDHNDPLYRDIHLNAKTTLRVMIISIHSPQKERIERLTQNMIDERFQSQVNLKQLVNSINTGRQVVLEAMTEFNWDTRLMMAGFHTVNRFFDTFLSSAIANYTVLKDQIITEKSKFIKDMHNDRLMILGQLAASFAHEFRNPLTSIKGFISLIERGIPESDQSSYYFSIINKEMESLEKKVTQFLYLSKMRDLGEQVTDFNLSLLIEEMVGFMYPRFVVENIKVDHDIQNGLIIHGIREEIKQVLLNILNNAVEELCEGKGEPVIQIVAKKEDAEGRILVSIMNNGREIPGPILENIFEPFMSTKELGTGLGLAVCKQIVEKHSGTIQVLSEMSKTEFHVTLPGAGTDLKLSFT